MEESVVSLISKIPKHRCDAEIESVLPWLRKRTPLLNDLGKEILVDVIRNCSYEKARKGNVIIAQGDKGDGGTYPKHWLLGPILPTKRGLFTRVNRYCFTSRDHHGELVIYSFTSRVHDFVRVFYIMLTGKTSVYIDTSKSDDDVTPVLSKESGATNDQNERLENRENPSEETDQENRKVSSSYGKLMINYEAGKSFGEVALLSEDSTRNATVVADEDTDLLVIYRDLFNRSLKASHEVDYKERAEFVSKCPLFNQWSSRLKRLLEISLRKETYPYGAVISEQGKPPVGLYFIIKGQTKIVAKPSSYTKQFPRIVSDGEKGFATERKGMTRNNSVTLPSGAASLTQRHVYVRRKQGYVAAEKRRMGKSIDICCIDKDEVFGDIEVVLELDQNIFSVIATAETTVFILDNKNIERFITRKNPATLNTLRHLVHQKLNGRMHLTKFHPVSLLKVFTQRVENMLSSTHRIQNKFTNQRKEERETLCKQLIQLFLEGRVPLIEPRIPDSLFYILKSQERRKKRKVNVATKVSEEVIDDAYSAMKRRIPRSLDQLKKMSAEEELLLSNRNKHESKYVPESRRIRPRTAHSHGGCSRERPNSSRTRRPQTATGVFRLTECDVDYDASKPEDDLSVQEKERFNDIFDEMEFIQLEREEKRNKIVNDVQAKKHLTTDLEKSLFSPVDEYNDVSDDEYFDYETSDSNLKCLENRMQNFFKTLNKTKHDDKTPPIMSLRRYEIEPSATVPLPGGTVFVKQKLCRYPKSIPITPDIHVHERRFMVSRPAQYT